MVLLCSRGSMYQKMYSFLASWIWMSERICQIVSPRFNRKRSFSLETLETPRYSLKGRIQYAQKWLLQIFCICWRINQTKHPIQLVHEKLSITLFWTILQYNQLIKNYNFSGSGSYLGWNFVLKLGGPVNLEYVQAQLMMVETCQQFFD